MIKLKIVDPDNKPLHRIADCILDCIRLGIPQATEWQRIGNQINAAFIFARTNGLGETFRR
jgi:hypothetical protein